MTKITLGTTSLLLLGTFFSASLTASETFTSIATSCATKYNVNVGRNERKGIDRVSGNASLDLVEFLLIFPKADRSKVALAWLECLTPKFKKVSNGEILPDAIISDNRTEFPDLTNKTLTVDTQLDVNGKKRQEFPFSVSQNCDVHLSWKKRSGLGFSWSYRLTTEYGSKLKAAFIGTNISPKSTSIGPGNYYLTVLSKRDAVRAQMIMVTRCR